MKDCDNFMGMYVSSMQRRISGFPQRGLVGAAVPESPIDDDGCLRFSSAANFLAGF